MCLVKRAGIVPARNQSGSRLKATLRQRDMLLQTGYPTELHGKVNATKIWDQIYLSKTEAFTRKENQQK